MRTAAKKPPTRKPAKKAPSAKAPAKKAPARKAPTRKAPAAKKATARKAPARKAPAAKKAPAKKAPSAKRAPTKPPAKAAAPRRKKPAPTGAEAVPRYMQADATGTVNFLFAPLESGGEGWQNQFDRLSTRDKTAVRRAATGTQAEIGLLHQHRYTLLGPVPGARVEAVRALLDKRGIQYRVGRPEFVQIPRGGAAAIPPLPPGPAPLGVPTAEQKAHIARLAYKVAAFEHPASALAYARVTMPDGADYPENAALDKALTEAAVPEVWDDDDARAAKRRGAGGKVPRALTPEEEAARALRREWYYAAKAYYERDKDEGEEDDDASVDDADYGSFALRAGELGAHFAEQLIAAAARGEKLRLADDQGTATIDRPPVLPLHWAAGYRYRWDETLAGSHLVVEVARDAATRGTAMLTVRARPADGGDDDEGVLSGVVVDRGFALVAELRQIDAKPPRAGETLDRLLAVWCRLAAGYGVREWRFNPTGAGAWLDVPAMRARLALGAERGWLRGGAEPGTYRCTTPDLRQTLVPGVRPNPGPEAPPRRGLAAFLGGR